MITLTRQKDDSSCISELQMIFLVKTADYESVPPHREKYMFICQAKACIMIVSSFSDVCCCCLYAFA